MRQTGFIWLAFLGFCLIPLEAETYTYDDSGRLIRVVYPSGQKIEYSYDKAGSMTSKSFFAPGELPGDGWHLVSPGTIEDLDQLFSTYSQVESVAGWNGTTYTVKYRNPPSVNPHPVLTSMQAGSGYWLQSSAQSVSITGIQDFHPQSLDSYTLNGSSGWRLLGTSVKIDDLNEFFAALPSIGVVWSYDSSSQTWKVFRRGDNAVRNQLNEEYETSYPSLREVEAHSGFWIFLGL